MVAESLYEQLKGEAREKYIHSVPEAQSSGPNEGIDQLLHETSSEGVSCELVSETQFIKRKGSFLPQKIFHQYVNIDTAVPNLDGNTHNEFDIV